VETLMKTVLFWLGFVLGWCSAAVEVKLDTSEVPHLKGWGEKAKAEIVEWYPRINNLLATEGFEPPKSVSLKIRKADKGVAGTAGTRIGVMSSWVEKHPEDVGVVMHELAHVIQRYRGKGIGWITEGIADYVRWAIYEGKQLHEFPRPQKANAYKNGYQVAAGFFLWLESGRSPGIVRRLNTASRNGENLLNVFVTETGNSVDELWAEYQQSWQKP
jgi:hypothetical protein